MSTHSKILFTLAAALFAFAASGCETPRQRQMILASFRVEAGSGSGDIDRGKRDWSEDSSWVAFSIAPFAGLEPPREVVVVQPPTEPAPCGRPR